MNRGHFPGHTITPLTMVQLDLVELSSCGVLEHRQIAPLLQPQTHWDEHEHDLLVTGERVDSRCLAITKAQAAEPCCLGSVAWVKEHVSNIPSSARNRSLAGGR